MNHKRFLNTRYKKDEQDFLKLYTSINKYEIPFRILDNTNLEKQLLEDALVNINSEQEFEFFHSSFANLLLLALISEDSKFKLQFPNGLKDFEASAFKGYLKLLTDINPEKYPYKIPFILTKVLANQQFDLFKFLVRDEEIKKLIVKYFKSVNDYEQYSLFFRNIAISCSNQYNYYYSQIVDTAKLNQILNATPKNFMEFKNILFIIREKSYSNYKEAIRKFPKHEIKKMILASRLNDITYTVRYIYDFDKPFAEQLISDITADEWVSLFNQASVFAVSNSTIELNQIMGRQFAADILSKVDTNRIINDSKREPIENITKLIKELSEINEGIAKNIAISISEQFLSDKISNRPLVKISKCLQELYPYKGIELSSIVGKFSDDELIIKLSNYNLSNIGRILSELFDINKKKISNLTLNSNFQDLLFSKLSEETNSGHVGKTIADLNKVHPESAILFVSKLSFEKIKNLVNKSTLEQLSFFIYSLFSTKGYEELAKKIFKSIPSKVLASKTLHKHFKITHYETIFSQFQKVDETKAKEILDCIENKALISKSIDFRVNARKVCQSLKSLHFVTPDKIKQVLSVIFKDADFNKKIDDLSVSDFIHTYAVCLAIDHAVSVAKFANRIDTLTPQQLNNAEISIISDAIKLMHKNLNLNKDSSIVKTFEKHLIENYSHYRLRQISIAFINLFSIDSLYASKLIEKLDIGILAIKALDIDSQENLNGCLGEIRTVNSNYWGQLTNEITRKKADIA